MTTDDPPPLTLHAAPRTGEPLGILLDGTRYPIAVLRRALRNQHTLYQAAQILGFEDTSDEPAILGRIRALVERGDL